MRCAACSALPRGHLTLSAPVLFGARFVMPIVTEYLNRYADVSVSCWFVGRLVNLMEEGVDVAVRIADLPDSSMQAIRVGTRTPGDCRDAGLSGGSTAFRWCPMICKRIPSFR